MSLAGDGAGHDLLGFPRVSGDEPQHVDAERIAGWFSPREWG